MGFRSKQWAAVSTTAGAMSVPEQSPTTDSEKRSPTAATAGKSDVGWPLMMRGSKPVSSPPHGVAARADANRRLTDSAATTNTVRNMQTSFGLTQVAPPLRARPLDPKLVLPRVARQTLFLNWQRL